MTARTGEKTMRREEQALPPWEFVVSSSVFGEVLATELYTPERGIGEIMRNSASACMSKDAWTPDRVHIELSVVTNHPLVGSYGKCTTIAMDAGRGHLEEDIQRACFVGAPDRRTSTRHAGAGQKGVGRLSCFSVNTGIAEQKDMSTGYYLLTRTTPKGSVMFVEITPDLLAEGRAYPRLISADDPMLGKYAGYVGSFSIFVIPNSVFTTPQQLREAAEWQLPRKRSLAYKTVLINDERLLAPPLPQHSIKEEGVEAYIEVVEDDKKTAKKRRKSGLYLTDETTALRCAWVPSLGDRMPYPLSRSDLSGDIFFPGLLANQDASREGLNNQFLTSTDWRDHYHRPAALKLAPWATSLLGDRMDFGQSGSTEHRARSIADLFNRRWGQDDDASDDGPGFLGVDRDPNRPKPPKDKPKNPGPIKNRPDRGDEEPKERPRRRTSIKVWISGEPYYFVVLDDAPEMFATVSVDQRHIQLNPKFAGFPRGSAAADALATQLILEAVGRSKHPYNSDTAARFAGQARLALLNKK